MPIFSIYVPKHIKDQYPHIHENLQKNTEKLTTAFVTISDGLNFVGCYEKRIGVMLGWLICETSKTRYSREIFYSDHGPRYSEIQNTNIGRVTSLMPIFSIGLIYHTIRLID
jgi:hypothetical protein